MGIRNSVGNKIEKRCLDCNDTEIISKSKCDLNLPCTTCHLKDSSKTLTLTRYKAVEGKSCVPISTLKWTKNEIPKYKCIDKQIPIECEKTIKVKTTKCIPKTKKIPIEKVRWEKKIIPCKKTIEKKFLVDTTKTITVPTK